MSSAYLLLAILAEAIGTSALKAAQGFTRPAFALFVVLSYAAAGYCLSVTTQTMSMGVAYAIWCAAGIALVSMVGCFYYGQRLDAPALVGLSLIVAGVAVLNVLSTSVHQ